MNIKIYTDVYIFESLSNYNMLQTRSAKLFKNGASQAVRLPSDFRFEGDEVYATRNDMTGDVVLSTRPGAKVWENFFALVAKIDVPDDFMVERSLNEPIEFRDIFGSDS